MCGIAGFCLAGKERHLRTDKLVKAGLLGIQNRGLDACGLATWDTEGIRTEKAIGKVKGLFGVAKTLGTGPVILHTRYATHGRADQLANAHPHKSGPITLTHNGMIWNHESICPKVDRLTDVDTEAAAILLAEKGWEELDQLDGSAALAWLDSRDRRVLFLARLTGSPLVIAQTVGGSLFYASTREAVKAMAKAVKVRLVWVEDVPSYTYLRVVGGRIAYRGTIPQVDRPGAAYWPTYTAKAATYRTPQPVAKRLDSGISPGLARDLRLANAWQKDAYADFDREGTMEELDSLDDAFAEWEESNSEFLANLGRTLEARKGGRFDTSKF